MIMADIITITELTDLIIKFIEKHST